MPQRLGRVGDAVIFRVSNEKCINAWTGNHVIMKRSTLAGTKLRKEQRNRNLDAKLGTLARCKCEAYQFLKKPWGGTVSRMVRGSLGSFQSDPAVASCDRLCII